MDTKKLLKKLFDDLSRQVCNLSEADLSKIEGGTHELALKVVKKKLQASNEQGLSPINNEEILKHLQKCTSRDEGVAYITDSLRNKKELEQFAKFLDVLVLKQDKVDQIKDKIIEATVGAVLRSNAIQGKKT